MGWLVAIICIILVVIFWRVLIPVAVVAAIAIGLLVLYLKIDGDRREEKRIQVEQEVQAKIAKAQAAAREAIAKGNATAVERPWVVLTQTDPASGEEVPRSASVLSDNGLCRLQVEQRINKTRLTGIYCLGLKVSSHDDIEVKFDNRSTSDKVRVEKFSNGEDVYIPSNQYGSRLQYDELLRRMPAAKKVAFLLTVEGAGQQWFTFSVLGSGPALTKIGAVASTSVGTHTSTSKEATRAQTSPPDDRVAPKLPSNAVLNARGNDWVCARGYRRIGDGCIAVQMPPNAILNVYGNDWVCARGYRRISDGCIAVQMPPNAVLNVYGNDWVCARGYRRSGDGCIAVQLPSNAVLNVYGNDWVCARGYRRSGDGCVAVQLPPNAVLNVHGNDWVCARGYRQSGSECVPVGVSSTSSR
jgi:hypothetical protein